MRRQQQALEHFWKSDQKSTLITGFWTCNKQGTSRGSKPVHIGDLHMGLISCLHQMMEDAGTGVTELLVARAAQVCCQVHCGMQHMQPDKDLPYTEGGEADPQQGP